MNSGEGLTRVAAVLRWFGYLAAAVIVIGTSVTGDGEVWVALIVGGILAVSGWAAAWIIDGFAKPRA